jgi:hypothetical protein
VRIRVRDALWCQDHADPGVAQPLSHRAAPFSIPIADHHTMSHQHAVLCRRRETHDLAVPTNNLVLVGTIAVAADDE